MERSSGVPRDLIPATQNQLKPGVRGAATLPTPFMRMPFDPNFPPHQAALISQQWRDQFNALKALDDAKGARIDALEAQVAAIPAGPPGPQGIPGNDGQPGQQGPMGEISAQNLADALNNLSAALIANSSANSNSVATMDWTMSDPPTTWELGTMFNTINALILALRRPA